MRNCMKVWVIVSLLLLAVLPFTVQAAEITPAQPIETVYNVADADISGFTVESGVATANAEGDTIIFNVSPVQTVAEAELFLYEKASVTVSLKGEEFLLTASQDGWYSLGRFTFDEGDTVTVTATNKNVQKLSYVKVGDLKITQLTEYIFYKEDAVKFEGMTVSGASVKGYKGSAAYYSNGQSITDLRWNVPSEITGATEIYYYVPTISADATTNMGVKITVLNALGGEDITFSKVSDYYPAGSWIKMGTFYPDGTTKTLQVSLGTNIPSTRFSAIKLVPEGYATYALHADNFLELGSWTRGTLPEAYKTLMLVSNQVDTDETTAYHEIDVENGNYYVYVHTLDYPYYSAGTRRFVVKLNGVEYKKSNSLLLSYAHFGTHQYPQDTSVPEDSSVKVWEWEQIGYPGNTVPVTDGKLKIELKAKSGYARLDGIIVTKDPYYVPSNDMNVAMTIGKTFETYSPYDDALKYPEKHKEEPETVENTVTLSNDHVIVTFMEGTLADGTKTVQTQTQVDGVITNKFSDGVGFLSLYAERTTEEQGNAYYANFRNVYKLPSGSNYEIVTNNIFRAGIPEWLVPNAVEKLEDGRVKMIAEGAYASLVAIWSLAEGDLEPKVDVTFTAKKDGEYSFGMFNNPTEIHPDDVGYILNPFRFQEKRLPDPGILIREATSTTNHTQMTYKINENGQEISLGLAADQSMMDNVWHSNVAILDRPATEDREALYLDMSDRMSGFGMGTTGYYGGVQPSLFAPLFGTDDAAFTVGSTYSFTYRPLATVSAEGENRGWYSMYEHVAKDLRGVYDFRDNYYASMTDTAFNLLNLLKDDEGSGWDENLVGHYNIEDTYWVTNANAQAYLQYYLLTEDKDLLMERTLPIMGTLLTRNSSHLNSRFSHEDRSEGPINKELLSSAFPTGNSGFEGAYRLSHGLMPVYRNIAMAGVRSTSFEKGGQTIQYNPAEALWYDYAKGDKSLSTAIKNADDYYNLRAFSAASNFVGEETFVSISYFPHFQSMVDVYEATGDEKYLAAAIEGARRMLPTLRVNDMPENKTVTRTIDLEEAWTETRLYRHGAWWWYDTGYRRGAVMKEPATPPASNGSEFYKLISSDKMTEDALVPGSLSADGTAATYPEWVTSRVGLALEQFSTCVSHSDNIYMSTWAPELLRVGYLADDQLMMDLARSSIVGRFANYPGYYIYSYNPTPGLADYAYKGYDTTSFYFHHIPVLLASVQDYLFSNAYVKSDGAIDFPSTRSEGYAWFNNRSYGAAPGNMYAENDMWPWLSEGTITVSSQQIDWIAGRKNGRAAFALTNAGDLDEAVTVTFSEALGVSGTATVYDAEGNTQEISVNNGKVNVTVPRKGIVTVAVNGNGITAPRYADIAFNPESDGAQLDMGNSAIGLMYEGKTYQKGNDNYTLETGYDVKAYALAMDTDTYMGYIFVGGRSTEQVEFIDEEGNAAVGGGDGAEDGIVSTTLSWRFEGDSAFTEVTDETFPYEFFIPAENTDKGIEFNIKTTFGNGTIKTLAHTAFIAPVSAQSADNEATFHGPKWLEEGEVKTGSTGSSAYMSSKGIALVLALGEHTKLGIESLTGFSGGSVEGTEQEGIAISGTLQNNGTKEAGKIAEVTFQNVPVKYLRLTQAQTNLCVEIAYEDILKNAVAVKVYDQSGNVVEADLSDVTTADVVVTPTMTIRGQKLLLEQGKFTENIGAFPEGTRFVTAEALDRLDYGYASNEYKLTKSEAEGGFNFWHVSMMSGLNGPLGVFTTDVSGTYKVYALRKDTPGGRRSAAITVNGTFFRFCTDGAEASADFDKNSWFWDDGETLSGAVATVQLQAGEPLLIQFDSDSSTYARVEAFAFVPANKSPKGVLYEQNLFDHALLTKLYNGSFDKADLPESKQTSVNGKTVVAQPYFAKVRSVSDAVDDVFGNFIAEPTVLDAILAYDKFFNKDKNDVFVNGKQVYAAEYMPIPENAVITTAEKGEITAENFAPIRASEVFNASGSSGGKLKYCLSTSKLPAYMQFADVDTANAFFTGAVLTGAFALNQDVTTDGGYTVEKGEKVYLQNQPITAVVRADTRTDLVIDSILNTPNNTDDWVHQTENGNFHKEGVTVNYVYDHSGMYIANKNTDGKVSAFKLENGYMLLANGASLIRILVANYSDDGAFLGVDHVENGYASFYDGYFLELEENQKAFLWNRSMYGNGNFTPLGEIVE